MELDVPATRSPHALRKYRPELLSAVAGFVFGFAFLYLSAPLNFVSKLVIVSGPTCAKANKLVAAIVADEGLQRDFLPLSISEEDRALGEEACSVAYRQVLEDAPWLRVGGREWVCRRLTQAADSFHDEAHAILPVWVHEGEILDVEERDRRLEAAGYRLLPGGDGLLRLDSSATVEATPRAPAGSMSEWRGQAIGF